MISTILTASFLIPLILSVVILYNSKEDRPKRIMGFCMVNAAGVFIANYFYFLGEFDVYQYFHSLHVALVLFIYPSIYLYLVLLTQQKRKSLYVHFIPGIFFFLLYIIFFDFKFPLQERIDYLSTYRGDSLLIADKFWLVNWIRLINLVAIVFSVIYYSTSIVRLSRKYNLKLLSELSNAVEYRITWLNKANIALIVVAVCSVIFYTIDPFAVENDKFLIFSMFLMSVFIWLMGIWGNAQKFIEMPSSDVLESLKNDQINKVEIQEFKILISNLTAFMEEKEIYRQSDLKLDDLSRLMGTNRTYLSRAINQLEGLNFNQFVNQYRIEEAQKMLKERIDLKIETIAMEAGFGSLSSFRRAFHKATGSTPEKWKA